MSTIFNRIVSTGANGHSHGLLAGLVLVAGLVSGCSDRTARSSPTTSATVAGNVLASVGSTIITRDDFQREVERRGRGPATEEERAQWVSEMVRLETLYANATTDDLDRDPEIQLALKKMVAGKYLEIHRTFRPSPAAIPEADVVAQYQVRQVEFAQPEKVRFAVILLKLSSKATTEKKTEMRAKADVIRTGALTRATQQGDFGPLAQQFSEDSATRFKGGDAGSVTDSGLAGRWPSSVLQAAFALHEKGEISPVVEAPDGLYLLKLIERQPASVRSLAEVAPMIRHQLTQQRTLQAEENFFAAETKRAGVTIHQQALQAIPLSPSGLALDSHPPTVPRQEF